VTNLRLIVVRGSELRDVLLQSIHSVELRQNLGLVVLGAVLAILPFILAPMFSGTYSGVSGAVSLLLIITGLALAAYGWANKFNLVLHYPGGKIVFRGGSNVHKVMIGLREALLKARHG
jgi:hypothetical protein